MVIGKVWDYLVVAKKMFQPFLRFWAPTVFLQFGHTLPGVSTLLEILATLQELIQLGYALKFQPFLRFWFDFYVGQDGEAIRYVFQPFLRFWGLCVWLLWVFKFFFGFLQVRRSAWNHALHSFHTALGKIETPFFGAPRKRRREKSGEDAPFFAVPYAGFERCWGVWGGGW